MWEKHLGRRALLILGVLVFGAIVIYPPDQKLKGGLDIQGGVSLIYEIDDAGLPEYEKERVAENMKTLLQKRVDPQGVYNLTWRVLGRNRLEVQMPLAPEGVKKLQQAYTDQLDQLLDRNITRGDLDELFSKPAEERTAETKRLAGGSAEREARLTRAVAAYDEFNAAAAAVRNAEQAAGNQAGDAAATAPATQPNLEDLQLAVTDAEGALQDAIDQVLGLNINAGVLQSILEHRPNTEPRVEGLKHLKQAHPELKDEIDQVVAAYDGWVSKRVGLDSKEDLQRLLKGAGRLDFRILAEPDPTNPTRYDRFREQLKQRGPRAGEGDEFRWFRIDNPMAFFDQDSPSDMERFAANKGYLNNPLFLADKYGDDYYVLARNTDSERDALLASPEWQLKTARISRDERGMPCVQFGLDPRGGTRFERLTGENVGKQLCILLDDVAYSTARIRSKIRESGVIEGDFTPDKVNYLVQTMQAGALPARLKDTPLSERTIEARLGQANLDRSFRAGLIGFGVVALFMCGYYFVGGAIAISAMMLNVFLLLAAMAMLGARFTLDGIAGVILTIGMSVDANVLIFERMREEKERGSSLRMIIKNGYDKAFFAIFDSNLTTLLSAIVLYYLGSEEVKGFGLTLGWGIVISLFTSLFVTRTIFTALVKYNVIKDIKMMKLIGVPNVDWYRMRKIFIPVSLVLTIGGLLTLFARNPREMLDVEFLGGVSAVVEVTEKSANGEYIDRRLDEVGSSISADARKLAEATVADTPGDPATYRVTVPGISSVRLAAMLTEPLEDILVRDGIAESGENQLTLRLKNASTAADVQARIRGLVGEAASSGQNIADASVNGVIEATEPEKAGLLWNVLTVETNKRLVQHALITALGDKLRTQPSVTYDVAGVYPITKRRLEQVIPNPPAGVLGDVTDYYDGAAIHFANMQPPLTLDSIRARLRNMRLQPGYQDSSWRNFDVVGLQQAGKSPEGEPTWSSVVVAVADQAFAYSDNRDKWETELAAKERELAEATLSTQQSLQKVTQFKPQIANQAKTRAVLALVFSWLITIAYMWIRFGNVTYGVAGVVALIHDIAMVLAFLTFASVVADTPLARALLLEDFKINMTIVAAFLTIVGYSINDTIVIFDRIRETRGRLGFVTPDIINRAINQCMSRTLLTGLTTLMVLCVMYVFAGSSIRGFNYCLIIGIVTGTYSSFAIAAPLLIYGREKVTTPAGAPARSQPVSGVAGSAMSKRRTSPAEAGT